MSLRVVQVTEDNRDEVGDDLIGGELPSGDEHSAYALFDDDGPVMYGAFRHHDAEDDPSVLLTAWHRPANATGEEVDAFFNGVGEHIGKKMPGKTMFFAQCNDDESLGTALHKDASFFPMPVKEAAIGAQLVGEDMAEMQMLLTEFEEEREERGDPISEDDMMFLYNKMGITNTFDVESTDEREMLLAEFQVWREERERVPIEQRGGRRGGGRGGRGRGRGGGRGGRWRPIHQARRFWRGVTRPIRRAFWGVPNYARHPWQYYWRPMPQADVEFCYQRPNHRYCRQFRRHRRNRW